VDATVFRSSCCGPIAAYLVPALEGQQDVGSDGGHDAVLDERQDAQGKQVDPHRPRVPVHHDGGYTSATQWGGKGGGAHAPTSPLHKARHGSPSCHPCSSPFSGTHVSQPQQQRRPQPTRCCHVHTGRTTRRTWLPPRRGPAAPTPTGSAEHGTPRRPPRGRLDPGGCPAPPRGPPRTCPSLRRVLPGGLLGPGFGGSHRGRRGRAGTWERQGAGARRPHPNRAWAYATGNVTTVASHEAGHRAADACPTHRLELRSLWNAKPLTTMRQPRRPKNTPVENRLASPGDWMAAMTLGTTPDKP
jgi:hypothetical protein